jgi:hypothetical protein
MEEPRDVKELQEWKRRAGHTQPEFGLALSLEKSVDAGLSQTCGGDLARNEMQFEADGQQLQ